MAIRSLIGGLPRKKTLVQAIVQGSTPRGDQQQCGGSQIKGKSQVRSLQSLTRSILQGLIKPEASLPEEKEPGSRRDPRAVS